MSDITYSNPNDGARRPKGVYKTGEEVISSKTPNKPDNGITDSDEFKALFGDSANLFKTAKSEKKVDNESITITDITDQTRKESNNESDISDSH